MYSLLPNLKYLRGIKRSEGAAVRAFGSSEQFYFMHQICVGSQDVHSQCVVATEHATKAKSAVPFPSVAVGIVCPKIGHNGAVLTSC